MVESAGAQSQVAQLAVAATVALVLLFLTGPLKYLPHCVLGALVFMIAIRLIKLPALLAIRRELTPGVCAGSDHRSGRRHSRCRTGDIVSDGPIVVPDRATQLPPQHRSHGAERDRNLEIESRSVRRDDGTRIGDVPFWRIALLRKCQPVRRRSELSCGATAFGGSVADCRRRGDRTSGLLGSACCAGIASDPDQLRNGIRLCADVLGTTRGLCPAPTDRGHRLLAIIQPAA